MPILLELFPATILLEPISVILLDIDLQGITRLSGVHRVSGEMNINLRI